MTSGADRATTAWCAGEAGLLRDIVSHVLAAETGIRVVPGGDATQAGITDLTVLVSPSAADWHAARRRGVPIIFISARALTDDEIVEAVLTGADAVFHAETPPSTLEEAIRVVVGGGCVLAPGQVRRLAALARADHGRCQPELTPRERQILASIARGEGVKQTARTLGISIKTVENLQSRLFRKLRVRNRSQAVAHAHALGLLSATP